VFVHCKPDIEAYSQSQSLLCCHERKTHHKMSRATPIQTTATSVRVSIDPSKYMKKKAARKDIILGEDLEVREPVTNSRSTRELTTI
jgi:hypothetical protein